MKRLYLFFLLIFTGVVINAHTNKSIDEWIQLGDSAIEECDYEKGVYYYELIKETYDKGHKNDEEMAYVLATLGSLYSKLGDSSKAIEYCIKAKDVIKLVHGENHSAYAILLGNLSSCYFDLGDYSKAVDYGSKALDIRE